MGLNVDTRFELCANAQRRAVLTTLDPEGPPVAVADLARQVAAQKTESTPDAVTESPQVQRIYVSLIHNHVPKLANAEVVSFDEDRQTVAPGPEFDAVRSLIEEVTQSPEPLSAV